MRKKNATLLFLLLSATAAFSQITVTSARVPQYIQGDEPTNNNRTPFWCWVELSGLTPNATYNYYPAMDSLNAAANSNGGGNAYLINQVSGTIRRTTTVSLTSASGHDSLTASSSGTFRGWIGIEPTGNGRFSAGTVLYVKLMLNNGAGGTSVAHRVLLSAYPVMVIDYGTTPSAALEGSGIYDSLNAAPKNFICLYDNVAATGRPVSIAIVENDGVSLNAVTSIVNFYRNMVDSMPMHWGTIVPNNLANGVRALEERSFANGSVVDTQTDADGIWCSGLNTVNMSSGNAGVNLNSTFVLTASAFIPDTAWTGLPANFNVTTNDPNATISWNFGDATTGSGANTMHTYTTVGVVSVTVIISNGGCSDTIWHNVVVVVGASVPRVVQLNYEISPNPTSGILNITAKSSIEKEILVYDVLGSVVYTNTFTGTNFAADLSTLEKGVYFLRITENVQGGKTATKRIVLQ